MSKRTFIKQPKSAILNNATDVNSISKYKRKYLDQISRYLTLQGMYKYLEGRNQLNLSLMEAYEAREDNYLDASFDEWLAVIKDQELLPYLESQLYSSNMDVVKLEDDYGYPPKPRHMKLSDSDKQYMIDSLKSTNIDSLKRRQGFRDQMRPGTAWWEHLNIWTYHI